MVWTCFPFIRSGQNHIAGHSEREKKRRQTENEVGRYIKEWTGLEFARQVSQISGKKRRKKKNGEKSYLWCPNDAGG